MLFNLKNQTITYNKKDILHSISFNIKIGEKVAILGKSGSGKSTLLKYLFSLQKNSFAYVPQDLSLVDNLSVFHNIYLARLDTYSTIYNIRNLIKPASKEIDLIKNILDDFDLSSKIFSKIYNLSGGQKQRVALVRAIFKNKDILLADEPISSLDEYLSSKTLAILNVKFKTLICSLHNVSLAINHFDRIIGLKDGKIILDKKCSLLDKEDINNLYYVCK